MRTCFKLGYLPIGKNERNMFITEKFNIPQAQRIGLLCDINTGMDDRMKWFKEYADVWIKKVGIREGQVILDFGSGEGNYTLPVAKAVGRKGMVYAYEKDMYALEKLKKESKYLSISNIKIIKSSGSCKLPFNNSVFDMVLFYDVLHSYYFTQKERKNLLLEAYRVLKSDGILSVFPSHMIEEEFIREVEKSGFLLSDKILSKLLHYGYLEEGVILNFVKAFGKCTT